MSILGTSYSKMVSGSTTVLFENSLIEPVYAIPDEIIHTSIFTGDRYYITKGDMTEINLTLNLFEYDEPKLKFNEIFPMRGALVEFYPHIDGDPIRDLTGNVVLMYLENINPYYLFQDKQYDIVNLKFISSRFTRLTPTDVSLWGYGQTYGSYYGDGF